MSTWTRAGTQEGADHAPRDRRRQHADRRRSLRRRRARRPLAHRDGVGTHLRRARPHDPTVPRLPRLLVPRQHHRRVDLVGCPDGDRRAAGDDGALLRLSRARHRARDPDRDADPVRQPEGGRCRPDRQRGRRLRSLRWPFDRRRLRDGNDDRGRERQGRVSRRRDLPRYRDLARRAVRARGRSAPDRARRAEARHREVDGRVDPIGRDLRVLGPGRRTVRPVPRRAGRVHRDRDGRLAELIGPHTHSVQHYEPWLTLFGLRIVFERNR